MKSSKPITYTLSILLLILSLHQSQAQQVDTLLTKRLFAAAGQAFQQGDFELNVRLTDSLAQAYADGGDYTGYAIFSMYNGWTHLNELKDYNRSEYYASRALRTVEEKLGGQLPYLDDLYSLLSSIYGSTGNSEKGLEYGHQAIQAVMALDKTGTFGDYVAHSNLATSYLELNQWSNVLPYLLKAKSILEQVVENRGWDRRLYINASQVQAKLTFCYLGLDEADRAMQAALTGKTYPEKAGNSDHFDFHEIYLALAAAHSRQGEVESAMHYYQKLENIYRNYFGAHSVQMAQLYQKRGDHYARYQDLPAALRENTQALRLLGGRLTADSLTIDPQSADLLCQGCEPALYEQRIGLLFNLGQEGPTRQDYLEACLKTTHLALESLDDIRQTILFREGSKQALFEQFQSIYRKGSLAAQQLHQLTGKTEYTQQAFALSEKSKAGILLEALLDSRAEAYTGLAPETAAEERRLSLEILQQEQLLEKALNTGDTLRSRAIQNGALFEAKQQYEDFLRRLAREHPGYFSARYQAEPATAGRLQAALDADELLVSYMLHPEDQLVQIFTVGNKGLHLTSSPWNEQSQALIETVFQSLQQVSLVQHRKRNRFIRQSCQLYQSLLDPIIEEMQAVSRLIIIPDGQLAFLPFEVLLPSPEDRPFAELNFLIKEKAFSYHYSGTVYLESLRKKVEAGEEIVAFAPVFSDGSSITQAGPASRSLLDTTLHALSRDRWQPLPGTEKEVLMIQQLFEAEPGQILLNEAADEAQLKKALQRGCRYIHIATHSFANPQNPRFSGIACAYTDLDEADEDGILYANEIYELDIRSDLVVLSSCESGIGTLMAGEGMLGLNRSFIYAGVPNVLYSLWKVDDQRSSELMIRFYEELRAGKTYEQALRQAKLTMLADSATALPAYWGAFALIGR